MNEFNGIAANRLDYTIQQNENNLTLHARMHARMHTHTTILQPSNINTNTTQNNNTCQKCILLRSCP